MVAPLSQRVCRELGGTGGTQSPVPNGIEGSCTKNRGRGGHRSYRSLWGKGSGAGSAVASGRSGLAVVPAPEVQRMKMGKETGLDAAPLRSWDLYFLERQCN